MTRYTPHQSNYGTGLAYLNKGRVCTKMRYSPQPVIKIISCFLNYATVIFLKDSLAPVLSYFDKIKESLLVEHVAYYQFFPTSDVAGASGKQAVRLGTLLVDRDDPSEIYEF